MFGSRPALVLVSGACVVSRFRSHIAGRTRLSDGALALAPCKAGFNSLTGYFG
jgi:hypothetical protein